MNPERQKFLAEFKEYAVAGFPWCGFRESLYQPLTNMFGHIAHYNNRGFWTTWFSTPGYQQQWLIRVQNWKVYGDPRYCWSDVETDLRDWVRDSGILDLVEARIPNPKHPRVIILCDGGLVQDVIAETPLDITLVDLDVEGSVDYKTLVLDRERRDADIRNPSCECDPVKVEQILKSIE